MIQRTGEIQEEYTQAREEFYTTAKELRTSRDSADAEAKRLQAHLEKSKIVRTLGDSRFKGFARDVDVVMKELLVSVKDPCEYDPVAIFRNIREMLEIYTG